MEATLLEIEHPTLGSGTNARSGGLHLSEVLRDLLSNAGLSERSTGWNKGTTFTAGYLWEEVLATHWEDAFSAALAKLLAKSYQWHIPGELLLDGITGTPDGVDINIPEWTLHEAKFTWKSVNKKPVDNPYYMAQIKSYCKMLGINHALLHVYFSNGDWKGSGPIYQPWHFRFTQPELDENWAMIRNHAEYMRER